MGLEASWAIKVSIKAGNQWSTAAHLLAPLNALVKIFEKRDLKAPFLAITAYSTIRSCIWRKLLKSLLFLGVIVEKVLVLQGRGGASPVIKFSSNVQVDHWYLPIIMFYISIETGM